MYLNLNAMYACKIINLEACAFSFFIIILIHTIQWARCTLMWVNRRTQWFLTENAIVVPFPDRWCYANCFPPAWRRIKSVQNRIFSTVFWNVVKNTFFRHWTPLRSWYRTPADTFSSHSSITISLILGAALVCKIRLSMLTKLGIFCLKKCKQTGTTNEKGAEITCRSRTRCSMKCCHER